MAEAGSSSRLVGNSSWNAVAFLVGVGLNLVILPFVVFRLGVVAFGVAGLVAACIMPALSFSNALALATARELTQRLSLPERADARRLFGTALLLAGAGGLSIAMVVATAGPPLARNLFNLGGLEASGDLAAAFLLGAGGFLCQCFSAVVFSLFTARQDYARLSTLNVATSIVSTTSMLLLIPLWPRASTYIGCQALGFAVGLLLALKMGRGMLAEWIAGPAFHRASFSALANIGGWQFAAQIGGLLATQADRYMLGAFLPPQFVGFYTIAQRLEEVVYVGVLKIGEILFPFFGTMQKEPTERVVDLLFRSSWVLNLLAACVLGALIPVAGPLLTVWTSAEVAGEAARVLVILSVAGLLGCSSNVFVFFLLAGGKSRSTAMISLATAIVTLLVSAAILPLWGWQAAGWSACAGMVAQLIVTVVLLRRSFDIPDLGRRIAHFVLLPLAAGIATALTLRYLAGSQLFDTAPRWWYVGGSYCLAAGIIFAVAAAVSRIGTYGEVCWRDLRLIASRFLSIKVS